MLLHLIVICVVLVLVLLKYRDVKHKRKYASFYKVPSPPSLPFLGHMWPFVTKNYLQAYHELSSKGLPCLVHTGRPHYITNIPEEIKIVLNHPQAIERIPEYDMVLGRLLHGTLMVANGSTWRNNRRFLAKSFAQSVLDSYVQTFYDQSQTLLDLLKSGDYDKENIFYLFEKMTLANFTETTLGEKTDILRQRKHIFVDSITLGQRKVMDRLGNPFKMNDFLYWYLPDGKIADRCKDVMFHYIDDILQRKKQSHNAQKADLIRDSKTMPALELMLENADKMGYDDAYIKRELTFFAGAATDTTAYTIVYTLLLLAMNPTIQDKLLQEILDIIGQEREITHRNLSQLKYLDMVINESMRLMPVVTLVARLTTGDVDLGTKVIPKGSTITVFIQEVHHNPKLYPDPFRYDPERFLPEIQEKRHPYAFLPFSGGAKNCIGWKYAFMVAKTTIANIVRNFQLKTSHTNLAEFNFESHIVISPKETLDLRFVERQY